MLPRTTHKESHRRAATTGEHSASDSCERRCKVFARAIIICARAVHVMYVFNTSQCLAAKQSRRLMTGHDLSCGCLMRGVFWSYHPKEASVTTATQAIILPTNPSAIRSPGHRGQTGSARLQVPPSATQQQACTYQETEGRP